MLICGKNINLRAVELEDAEFIFALRTNQDKTKYLSKVTGTIEDQRTWIKSYKVKELNKEEFYFVIESKVKEKLGLVRVYDFIDSSFSWGSWIIKDGAPTSTAIESALQIYEFGFYKLNFKRSHFDVTKGNDKVLSFHKKFGAVVIDETPQNYMLNIDETQYIKTKQKYKRYL
ncbi:MAG: GNAT family N-acetyltransferase [Campylobacterota bacterium]|nr:GNAT family N-acetyltransferase [Campylobacterota bacterium]